MSSIQIKESLPSNISLLANMWQAIDRCSTTRPFGGDNESKLERAQDIISHAISAPTACVLIATTSDDDIIGTITGHLYQRPAVQLSSVGVIYSLWVEVDHRNQGIGQALLDAVERQLITMGAQAFQVGWDTANTHAGQWWAKRGYAAYEVIASKDVKHT